MVATSSRLCRWCPLRNVAPADPRCPLAWTSLCIGRDRTLGGGRPRKCHEVRRPLHEKSHRFFALRLARLKKREMRNVGSLPWGHPRPTASRTCGQRMRLAPPRTCNTSRGRNVILAIHLKQHHRQDRELVKTTQQNCGSTVRMPHEQIRSVQWYSTGGSTVSP